jgi:hypothetical protein
MHYAGQAAGEDMPEVGKRPISYADAGVDVDAGELAGVFAHLGGCRDPHSGELIGGIGDQPAQGDAPGVAGADQGDAYGHVFSCA